VEVSCKGKENREHIVSRFSLSCIAHIRLLEPNTRKCCCGKSLGNDAYLFIRTLRTNLEHTPMKLRDANSTTFATGRNCAKKLAEQAGIALAPKCGIFDSHPEKAVSLPDWDPLNLELYRGIQCLCSLTGHFPTPVSQLGRFLAYLSRNPSRKTNDFAVVEFSRRIADLLPHTSSMRADYASLMGESELERFDVCFPLMESVLALNKEPSHL
jgi:hypothetical protein